MEAVAQVARWAFGLVLLATVVLLLVGAQGWFMSYRASHPDDELTRVDGWLGRHGLRWGLRLLPLAVLLFVLAGLTTAAE
jgi:hypothetical protein